MSGTDWTLTPNLGLYKPIYDHDDDNWGAHINSNADILDGWLTTGAGGKFLPLAGGTVTGTTTFSGAANQLVIAPSATGAAAEVLNAAAGQSKQIRFQTVGVDRWVLHSNTTAESGSNAGSDFEIRAYADGGGAALSVPFNIMRATGQVVANNALLVGGTALSGHTRFEMNPTITSNGSFFMNKVGGTHDGDNPQINAFLRIDHAGGTT